MGMYTSLKVSGKIKPELIPAVREMIEKYRTADREQTINSIWMYSNNPKVRNYGLAVGRASFIPNGAVTSYYRCESDDPKSVFYHEKRFDIADDGSWNFVCSLKNYEWEIQDWFEQVVPEIFSEFVAGYHYEEWESPEYYHLEDGTVMGISGLSDNVDAEEWVFRGVV
jgi:hypothetical protein